jgi:hypothetical protein
MTTPAPTPEAKTLQRVLLISRLNGWSVIIVAGLGVLLALILGDLTSIFIGLLVAAAGYMEVRGHQKLKRRNPEGMPLLVRSQMFLLAVILAYCASRLFSFDPDSMLAGVTPEMKELLKESGISLADIVPLVHQAFLALYGTLAVTCLIYQGGMAIYYRRRTLIVAAALRALPVIPPSAWSASIADHDQPLYDAVATELGARNIKPGLWARALAETSGEEAPTKARYIQLRVAEMKRDAGLRPG